MASEYRDEVEQIINQALLDSEWDDKGQPGPDCIMRYIALGYGDMSWRDKEEAAVYLRSLIALGIRLGLEAAAAAAKESELREGTAAEGADGPEFAAAIEGEAVAHNIGLAILSLSPTDILKAKGGRP